MRHFEIWAWHQDDPDGDSVSETVNGTLEEAIDIIRYYHSEGYYAYILDMDKDGSLVMVA